MRAHWRHHLCRYESRRTELFSSRGTSACRQLAAAAMAVAVATEEVEMQVAAATTQVAVMKVAVTQEEAMT